MIGSTARATSCRWLLDAALAVLCTGALGAVLTMRVGVVPRHGSAHGEAALAEAARRHAAHADCLWLAARDHGFYMIQSRVLDGIGDSAERHLWETFVATTAAADCGTPPAPLTALEAALAAQRDAADRYFLGAGGIGVDDA